MQYGAECDTLLQGGVQDAPYALEVRDGVRQACTEWDGGVVGIYVVWGGV